MNQCPPPPSPEGRPLVVWRIAHHARRQPGSDAGRGRRPARSQWRRVPTTLARHPWGWSASAGSIQINGVETVAMAPPTSPAWAWAIARGARHHDLAHLPGKPDAAAQGGRRRHERERSTMFPNLLPARRSPGGRLSGGEQQMLAVARILRTGARCVAAGRISRSGPVIVQALARMIRELRTRGFTVLMVEQNFRFAAPLADRFYIAGARPGAARVQRRRIAGQHGHAAPVSGRVSRSRQTCRSGALSAATIASLAPPPSDAFPTSIGASP